VSLPLVSTPGTPPTEKPKAPFSEADADAFFGRQWRGLMEWFKSPEWLKWLWGCVEYIFTRLVALVFGLASVMGAKLAEGIAKAEDLSQPAFEQLTRAAIKDLLGVEVQIGGVGKPGERGHHAHVARDMGDAVIKSLFGEVTGASAQTLGPSDANARRFLTAMLQLAFEGWLEGWVAEALSVGQLETFADLDDTLVNALGLGRLSRRVLAPPMSILIEQPFTWLLNRTYRPTLLGSGEAIRQHLRGRYTRERLFSELALAGYKDEDIEALIATHQRFFSVPELVFLNEMENWTDQECVQHLRDQGYSEEMAKAAMALARAEKIDGYKRQAAGIAGAAYEERDIDEGQFRRVLDSLDLPTYEREWIFRTWGLRREFNIKHLSMSDLSDAVKRGILTIADFRREVLTMGYSLADAQTLELMLLEDIRTAEEAKAAKERAAREREEARRRRQQELEDRRREAEARAAERGISLAQEEALVLRGLRTLDQYGDWLRAEGYAAQAVSDLVELLGDRIEEARTAAERKEELAAAAARKKLSLAELERAVKLQLMSVDEYRSQLAAIGFSDEDRQLLATMLQKELDQAAAAAQAKAAAQQALAVQHIALADLELAVRRGLRSVDQYHAELLARGFAEGDADLLADLLRQDLAADQAARDRQAEIAAALKKRKISLAELQAAVRAGIATMAEYRATLAREGYSDTDIDLLVRLLRLQIDADRQAAEKRKQAETRLAEAHISLSDLERAVKLGVTEIATYKAALAKAGFSTEDQMILTQALLAEVAKIREAQQKEAAAAKAAAKRKISLSDFERAVRLGLRTVVEYQALLAELGYGPPDQQTLVQLLQLQMAQDQAAQQKRQEAETTLAARGLSLSQMERAVLEGVKTLAEYRAWLIEQAYAPEDADVLLALLELRLAAQAQRQQGPSI